MNITRINKSSFFNTIGVLANSAGQWAIVSLLGRFYSIDLVGNYSYLLALITPLHLLFSLQLRNYFNSTYSTVSISELFKLRAIFSLFFILSSIALLPVIGKKELVDIFYILIFTKFFEGFSEFTYAQKQKEENILYIGVSQSLRSLFIIVLCIIVSLSNLSFVYLMLALLIPTFMGALIDIHSIRKNIFYKKGINTLILKKVIPLSFAALITSFNINIPRYMLEILSSMKAVGIYSTIFFFYAIILIIINSLIQILLKKLSQSSKSKTEYQKSIYSLFKTWILASLCFILFNTLLGSHLYILAYGEKFKIYTDYLYHLNYLIPLGLATTKLNYLAMAQNSYTFTFISSVSAAIIHLASSYYLTSTQGIQGAFHALAISLIINIALNTFIISKKVRDDD